MRSSQDAFHIAIPTYDLDVAVGFYVSQLGAKLARRYPDRVTFDFFGDQLVCHLSETVPAEPVPYPRHFGLTFANGDDFDRLLRLVAVSMSWNAGDCCGTAAADNLNDGAFLQSLVAYADPGYSQPAATTEIAALRVVDSCPASSTAITQGSLRLTTWTCQRQSQIMFAVYAGGGHSWPPGNASTASAASLIWAFFRHSVGRRLAQQ